MGHPAAAQGSKLGAVVEAWGDGWRPEPTLTVSAWADSRRFLTSRSAAEPGPWRTSRFPFTREIMDALGPTSRTQRVVWMAARQLAKTECILNAIGHAIECAPGPILMVQPSIEMAKKVSKQRVAPMIDAAPSLRSRVRPTRERDSGNTLFTKEFDDGILIMTGSNSSANLRGQPVRRLFADEVDEYARDADEQGDALKIAEACTANFPNRKICITGNPGIRGRSRIETEYLAGDQRRYFIPCPACGAMDFVTWNGRDSYEARAGSHHRIAWARDEAGGHLPATAHMVCGSCGAMVAEAAKTQMLEDGEWRATAVAADGATRSYHLSGLYRPAGYKSWSEMAREFLAARADPDALRAFVNHDLGETWEERAERANPEDLASPARQERYDAEVPVGVGVLVASVDVQADRLAYVVKGYGAGEESWLIEWAEVDGDPKNDAVWHELDRLLLRREWTHAGGRRMRIERVAVDSGGHHTDEVYAYCRMRTDRGVYAVKGGSEIGRPLVGIATRHNRYKVPLFVLCTDTGKMTIVGRLKIAAPGPGYCHLPAGIDREYLEQLTAERAVYKWSAGRSIRVWKKRRDRNEAFDLEVYALAALKMLGAAFIAELGTRAAKWAAPPDGSQPAPAAEASRPQQPAARRPRSNWVKNW